MSRASKIDRLPPEVREEIGSLRRRGHTIDQILAKLRELLAPEVLPSWSGVQRHVQGLDQLAERMQRSRAVAEALVERLGDAPEDRTARLNIELTHTAILDLFLAPDGEPVTLDPESAMQVSATLRNLATAKKLDAEHTLKIEAAAEKKAKAEAAKAVEQVAKRAGLSADLLDQLRAGVFGKDAA